MGGQSPPEWNPSSHDRFDHNALCAGGTKNTYFKEARMRERDRLAVTGFYVKTRLRGGCLCPGDLGASYSESTVHGPHQHLQSPFTPREALLSLA